MPIATDASGLSVAWWKEPTKDQWLAWIAAWLGWMLDAFDFTLFLLIMVPEVRTTASGFCLQFGSIFGGLVPPVIAYFAVEQHMGFATPMLIGTLIGAGSVIMSLLMSSETKGKVFVPDLMSHTVEVPLVSPAS